MVDLHGLHGIQGIGSGKDVLGNGNYGGLSVPSEQAHARNYSGCSCEQLKAYALCSPMAAAPRALLMEEARLRRRGNARRPGLSGQALLS